MGNSKSENNEKPSKTWFGLPMRWDRKNIFKNFWNPDDDRIFPPKYYGIGWDLNVHALLKFLGLIKKKKNSN